MIFMHKLKGKAYFTFLFYCIFSNNVYAQENKDYRFSSGLYFTYTSQCNIAIQINDSSAKIILNECCGEPIDSLTIVPSTFWNEAYDIINKDNVRIYTLFKQESSSKDQIEMLNNGINGPAFQRWDENGFPIGITDSIITCESGSKVIDLWTSLDSESLKTKFTFHLDFYLNPQTELLDMNNIKPYIDKAKALTKLKRYNEAEWLYLYLEYKFSDKIPSLYKDLADYYLEINNKSKENIYKVKYSHAMSLQ